MSEINLAADMMVGNLEMVKGTLADFSEQDMLLRPVPNANHTAWQLGHVITAENRMISGVTPGAAPALPAGFAEKFTKETAKVDDAGAFPSKAELLDALTKTRMAAVAWARSLSAADLAKPGPESIRSLAPTVGHLVLLIPIHMTMHLGQFQVVRRKLGRPVMF